MTEADRLIAMNARQPFGPGFFIFLGILSLLIGSSFVFAGIRFRVFWLIFWGSTLVLAGVALLAYAVFYQMAN
jgi:uncharacterized membrane protein HdeD (DUF308 family)